MIRFFRAYKDGRIEKFQSTHKIPPSDDPITGVRSKDVEISSQPAISARIFLPKIHDPTRKLPVLFYCHGGGFCFLSAFSPLLHNYVSALAAEAEAIAVSVVYRLAPEHPIRLVTRILGLRSSGWLPMPIETDLSSG
jgi:acetyl esterase/lipase